MNLTVLPAALDEVQPHLLAALEHDASGALSLADVTGGAQLFKLTDEAGRTVGAYALKVDQYEHKRVAWVMAAGGNLRGVDLARTMLAAIRHQAQGVGAHQIGFVSRRRGLIQKMMREGFAPCGVDMRLDLQ